MPEPHVRAADTDRAAVAEELGEHMSAGRLTVDEFDDRLSRAYAAKTYGELDELTADLPPLRDKDTARVPARREAHAALTTCGAPSPWGGGWHQSHSWRSWLTTSLIVVTIWAATSLAAWDFHYFWPIWVIGPWGAILLAQTLSGRGHDSTHGQRRARDRT
jgi:hypothetical protein